MKINKLNYVLVKEFTLGELEKLESIMVEQGFSVIEEVSDYSKSNYSQYGVDMDGNTFFFDYWFTDKGKDITDKFRNYLDNDKGITEDDNNTKTFTKSSLKDGMVVTYRESYDSNNLKRVVFKGSLYSVSEDGMSMLHGVYLKYFSDTLEYDNDEDMDIMKVEYMGEVLWEREDDTKKKRIKELQGNIAKMQEELNKLL